MGGEKAELSILEFQKSCKTWPLYLAAFLLCIHNTVIGLSLFYASVTLPYHKDEVHGFIKLTEEQESTYLSMHQLLMLLGSFLGSPLGDKIGRKKVLIISNILTILSTVMMQQSTSYILLLIGRLISGFSVGLGILIPIILLSEISTIKTRSSLSNTCNLAINFGALAIYLFNMVMPPELLSYSIIAPSIGFLALSYFLPESPHWQISTGRTEAAKENYSYLRGSDYEGLEAEVNEVLQVKERAVSGNKSRWTSRGFLHPMGILAFLFSTIGLCGLDAPITFYGPKMFAEFGFHIPYQYVVLMIPIGSFIGYIVAIPLLAIMKKKHQYNMCALFMALSTACLGGAYYIEPNENMKYIAQVLLSFGALGVTFGYGVGLGSVVYCLPGELLAPEDKALGVACAEFFRLIWTAGILKVYPLCLSLVGYPIMFGFHTSILLVSVWFVWCYLPETKDKSLSELQAMFYLKKKEKEAASV